MDSHPVLTRRNGTSQSDRRRYRGPLHASADHHASTAEATSERVSQCSPRPSAHKSIDLSLPPLPEPVARKSIRSIRRPPYANVASQRERIHSARYDDASPAVQLTRDRGARYPANCLHHLADPSCCLPRPGLGNDQLGRSGSEARQATQDSDRYQVRAGRHNIDGGCRERPRSSA
jgi:hypothetical protein